MKEPGPIDMAVGHPAVVVTGSVMTIAALVAAFNDGSWWPAFAFLVIVMIPVCKASEARQAYLPWKRQWDSMSEPEAGQPRAPASPTAKRWIGIGMLALLGLFFADNASDPVYARALAWLVITAVIASVVALVWNRRKSSGATTRGGQPVGVCIRHPVLPVPALGDAYRALPPHCHALFRAQGR